MEQRSSSNHPPLQSISPAEFTARRKAIGLSQAAFAYAMGLRPLAIGRNETSPMPMPLRYMLVLEALEARAAKGGLRELIASVGADAPAAAAKAPSAERLRVLLEMYRPHAADGALSEMQVAELAQTGRIIALEHLVRS